MELKKGKKEAVITSCKRDKCSRFSMPYLNIIHIHEGFDAS